MSGQGSQHGSWHSDSDDISVSHSSGSSASQPASTSSIRTTTTQYKPVDFSKLTGGSKRTSKVVELEGEGSNWSTSGPPRSSSSSHGPKHDLTWPTVKEMLFGKKKEKSRSSHKKKNSSGPEIHIAVDRRDSFEEVVPPVIGKGKAPAHRDSFNMNPPSASSGGSAGSQVPYRTEIHTPSWARSAQEEAASILEDARLRYEESRRAYQGAGRVAPPELQRHLYNNYVRDRAAYTSLQRGNAALRPGSSGLGHSIPPQRERQTSAYHGIPGSAYRNNAAPTGGSRRPPPFAYTAPTGSPSLHQGGVEPRFTPNYDDASYPAGPQHRDNTPNSASSGASVPPRTTSYSYNFPTGTNQTNIRAPVPPSPTTHITDPVPSPRRQDGRYGHTFVPDENTREDLRPPSGPSSAGDRGASPPSTTPYSQGTPVPPPAQTAASRTPSVRPSEPHPPSAAPTEPRRPRHRSPPHARVESVAPSQSSERQPPGQGRTRRGASPSPLLESIGESSSSVVAPESDDERFARLLREQQVRRQRERGE
jgi:hypothetical protein